MLKQATGEQRPPDVGYPVGQRLCLDREILRLPRQGIDFGTRRVEAIALFAHARTFRRLSLRRRIAKFGQPGLDVVDTGAQIDGNRERFSSERVNLDLQIGKQPVLFEVLFHLIPKARQPRPNLFDPLFRRHDLLVSGGSLDRRCSTGLGGNWLCCRRRGGGIRRCRGRRCVCSRGCIALLRCTGQRSEEECGARREQKERGGNGNRTESDQDVVQSVDEVERTIDSVKGKRKNGLKVKAAGSHGPAACRRYHARDARRASKRCT